LKTHFQFSEGGSPIQLYPFATGRAGNIESFVAVDTKSFAREIGADFAFKLAPWAFYFHPDHFT